MTAPTHTTAAPPLTHADRCDRCGAQALVRAVLKGGELLFCGHHARDNAAALAAVALSVQESEG